MPLFFEGAGGGGADSMEPTREELFEELEAFRASKAKLQKNRLIQIGKRTLGWEDVIVLLAIIVIFVSWVQGAMTYQEVLVALFGTGAGGAWGFTTGKGYS